MAQQFFKDSDLQHTPEEMEFFAEDEEVTIVPYFSLNTQQSKIFCIEGECGPFQPNFPVKVPMWVAVFLYNKKKCRIELPEWLTVGSLQDIYEQERGGSLEFQPLPFRYLEVAHVLLTNAKECFSAKEYIEARDLVDQIRRVRSSKLNAGMEKLTGPLTAKLNNVCAMEINTIRPFFLGTLDRYFKMEKAQMGGQADEGEDQ